MSSIYNKLPSCLILRSMSALDLSLAAKMMQKVQSRKRRKCANGIAFVNNNCHFSQFNCLHLGTLRCMTAWSKSGRPGRSGKFDAVKLAPLMHLKRLSPSLERTLLSQHRKSNVLAGRKVPCLYSIRQNYNRQFCDCKTLEMIEDGGCMVDRSMQ